VAFLVDKDVLWFERLGKGKSWLAFLVTDEQQPMLWVCIDILESLTTKLTRKQTREKKSEKREIYNLPFSFFFSYLIFVGWRKTDMNDLVWMTWMKNITRKCSALIFIYQGKSRVCMCLGFFFYYPSFVGGLINIGLDI